MNEEERQVGYELIKLLSKYQEDVRRLAVKLSLSNIELNGNYNETVEGSLLDRVYDREVKKQIIMRGDNIVGELTGLMRIIEDVSFKITEDVVED
ncbi:hypothetical protein SN811_01380 [Ligilactobacillus agilis]|uniref:Uncharacterized protein n=1 Tax=Ligilactobacillus agilis TaxID=1601 RepID=A0A6F9Y2H5_9LACO|nr:hypothetical protein [Ligilactobacillus agilis]GET11638.1 hypothetical protein SN811_01380 [Ligilactobacillus agilis]